MRFAVIMPHIWRGGMARFAVILSNILSQIEVHNERAEVSLCVPLGYDISALAGLGKNVSVAEVAFIEVKKNDFRFRSCLDGLKGNLSSVDGFTLPVAIDNKLDLSLADVWILLTGLLPCGPLLPVKPYIVYAPDFIQRVVPEIFGDGLGNAQWGRSAAQNLTMQFADAVFATTPRTALDAVSYAGVSSARVSVLPMIHAPLQRVTGADRILANKRSLIERFLTRTASIESKEDEIKSENQTHDALSKIKEIMPGSYFLWVTNTTAHKNQVRALKAIQRYYEHEDGKFYCVVCGALTNLFEAEDKSWFPPHLITASEIIRDTNYMNGKLVLAGEVPEGLYQKLLRNAAFLWHNVLYDNGTFAVIEAAELGTKSLVSSYPQIKFIAEEFAINVTTFDPWDIDDAAQKLKRMEVALLEEGPYPRLKDPGDLQGRFKAELTAIIDNVLNKN